MKAHQCQVRIQLSALYLGDSPRRALTRQSAVDELTDVPSRLVTADHLANAVSPHGLALFVQLRVRLGRPSHAVAQRGVQADRDDLGQHAAVQWRLLEVDLPRFQAHVLALNGQTLRLLYED